MNYKYWRITANSQTSYEYLIKVPDSITEEDIWNQKGGNILDGGNFTECDEGWGGSGDWEWDECNEIEEEKAKREGYEEWDAEDFLKK